MTRAHQGQPTLLIFLDSNNIAMAASTATTTAAAATVSVRLRRFHNFSFSHTLCKHEFTLSLALQFECTLLGLESANLRSDLAVAAMAVRLLGYCHCPAMLVLLFVISFLE